jgi:hypothetical protein
MADKRLIKTSPQERKKRKFSFKRLFLDRIELFSIFNRILKKIISKTKHAPLESKGIATILLIFFLPVITLGIHYLVEYTKKSDFETGDHEIPYVIAKNVAKSFNPGRTWDEQKDYLYSVAAQTYNDGAYNSEKVMKFELDKVYKAKISAKSFSDVFLLDFYSARNLPARRKSPSDFIDKGMFVKCPPFSDVVYNEGSNSISMNYLDESGSGETLYLISKYKENSRLALSLNSDGKIKVKCSELKKVAEITLPRNDVDIILAIPTNHASNTTSNDNTASFGNYSDKSTADSTPIKQIARACQAFLEPFLHTAGVSVGIVPYSGKVTLSPHMSYDSITIETPMNVNPSAGLTYVMQAMFYGSDGKAGGDIILRDGAGDYGIYTNWGKTGYGYPIMARRGEQQLYREMTMNSGAISGATGLASLLLDMTTIPTAGDNYKFMRMNTNPCYLGFCNTLAMTCEKDCPTYRANPYFLTELNPDIQGVICDLELFVPFKDKRNKSNFLFLPLVMAGNLFSWGDHPSNLSDKGTENGRVPEKDRRKKVRAVVIIANAPDNFEPMELTYLGFNNDYSEIPMIESDTILFNQDRGYAFDGTSYMGVKGAVRFKTSYGSLTPDGYLFSESASPATARISFPNKAMLRIVTERVIPAEVEIYNDNGVEDNVGVYTFKGGEKRFYFRGPQQVKDWTDLGTSFESGNYTTGGPNFGHNLSVKKVKIRMSKCRLKRAILWNQILRFYGIYAPENGKPLIENTSGSVSSLAGGASMPTEMIRRMDPCIYAIGTSTGTDGWSFEEAGTRSDTCGNLEEFDCNCYSQLSWHWNPVAMSGLSKGWIAPHGWEYATGGPESSGGDQTICDKCSHYVESTCTTPKASISSGYYIGANDFSLVCRGVAFTKFIFAADNLRTNEKVILSDGSEEKVVTLGNAEITTLTKGGGEIGYDTSTGVKYKSFQHIEDSNKSARKTIARKAKIGDTEYNRPYTMLLGDPSYGAIDHSKSHSTHITNEACDYGQCFVPDSSAGEVCGDLADNGSYSCQRGYWIPCYKNCQEYDAYHNEHWPNSGESPIDKYGRATIKFNPNTIKSYDFYKIFATKKKRERTVKHEITTKRSYSTAASSGDPGTYPNTPCCSEVWATDPCGRTETGCVRYEEECDAYGYKCNDDCTRYGGQRKYKSWGAFKSSAYWCGHMTGYYTTDDKGNVLDKNSYRCLANSGDDMGEAGEAWKCTPTCTKVCRWTKKVCKEEGDVCAATRYNTGSYNANSSCTGVCWDSPVSTPSGWSNSIDSKSVSCNGYYPSTKQVNSYSYSQSQDSISDSCKYSDGSNNNSSCEYDWIVEPYNQELAALCAYVYTNCSGCSCGEADPFSYIGILEEYPLCRSGVKWTETATEEKRLSAFYQRNTDGSTQFPQYKLCNKDGTGCTEITPAEGTELEYNAGLRQNGIVDESKTKTDPFRFNLYNFFFVNMDGDKRTTYHYNEDRTINSAGFYSSTEFLAGGLADAENHRWLLYNVGPLLLPTEEENIYWLCFCGDADLWLDIEDISDSSITFDNLNTRDYTVSMDTEKIINDTPGVEVNYIDDERIFYIHPNQISDNLDEDGNYYVDLTITGETRIRSIELTNRPFKDVSVTIDQDYLDGKAIYKTDDMPKNGVSTTFKYYDHPNIIDENLLNTRIIDGYDQGKYQNMRLYGNINYDHRSDLPLVSAMQYLYYNPKDGYSPKRIYPNNSLSENKAQSGEEGDFFVQLWDWKDEVPDIQWKIESDFRTEMTDITAAGSDFGSFRSNYAFNGLHRMFFPYTTYNKDHAGYSRAKHSAQVFIGYTLPINYILANSGYQQAFRVDSGYVTSYTKPNKALENLAKDACTKLKELTTDWKGINVVPMVFLVKYRTSSTLSLEDCASVYTADNEKELTEKLIEISKIIEAYSRTTELSVNVKDM